MLTQSIINNFLIEQELNKIRNSIRTRGIYWPSEASLIINNMAYGSCLRELFYKIKKISISNPPTLESIRRMKYGKLVELGEIEIAAKLGILAICNFSFLAPIDGTKLQISGKLDSIYKINESFIGIEYKSGSGYMFNAKIFGTASKVPEPRLPHLFQVMIYLWALKNNPQYSLSKFSLIYLDRGIGKDQEFLIEMADLKYPVINGAIRHDISITNIFARYQKLDEFIENNILPPGDYVSSYSKDLLEIKHSEGLINKSVYNNFWKYGHAQDNECSYCLWSDRCRRDNKI